MSKDSKELKKDALSEEELAQVTGGMREGEDFSGQCSHVDPEYGIQCQFCIHAAYPEKWCEYYNIPTYNIPAAKDN